MDITLRIHYCTSPPPPEYQLHIHLFYLNPTFAVVDSSRRLGVPSDSSPFVVLREMNQKCEPFRNFRMRICVGTFGEIECVVEAN